MAQSHWCTRVAREKSLMTLILFSVAIVIDSAGIKDLVVFTTKKKRSYGVLSLRPLALDPMNSVRRFDLS